MANCPKCGHKLHLYNISQFCPTCGVNLCFYGFEERFYHEAKLAELTQAGVHIKIRRLKAAFIGSKLTILRLVAMLLPLVSLLLPTVTATICLPFKTETVPLSALGLYNAFSGKDLTYILDMTASDFTGTVFAGFEKTMLFYLAPVLLAVLVLLSSILCFISYKNMQKITCILAALGMGASAVVEVIARQFVAGCSGTVLHAVNGYGMFLTGAMFAFAFVINLLLWIKGIPVEYGEGMLERTEIYKKVKKGEIDLDSLPQPVVETAATRAIEEEIAKQGDSFNQAHKEVRV